MFLTLARKVIHSHRAKRIEAMHGQPQWCKVPAGFWMYIDPSEWLGKTLLMGYYESHLVFLISQVCQRGDVCVDIGANQGYISLQMARRVGTEGCVLAIEPIEPTFERLVGNIQRNRASQVHCIHRAAGACVQSLEIWYDPSESGHASVYNRPSEQATRVTIQVEPADSILEQHLNPHQLDKLIFAKIDVEGFEPLVLQGFRRTLQRSQPLLWIEKNPNCLQKGGFTVSDITRPLCELGYRVYEVSFRRNFLGIASLTLSPADIHSERFNAEFDDIVAVVPHSEGWERLQRSRIHVR
jgi:FkbM family methyltransferase